MRSFIYDQYGYQLEKDLNEFSYQGYDFRLIAHEKTEEECQNLQQIISGLKEQLPFPIHVAIVESRNHTIVTENEFGYVSLVAAKKDEYKPEAIIKMIELSSNLIQNYNFSVSDLIELWEEKLALIEEKYIADNKIDDYAYPIINTESIYAIGLASNAIQYLVDIKYDYGNNIDSFSLSHKRLNSLKGIDVFNPFNLISDAPSRDLAFLFASEKIQETELFSYFQRLSLSKSALSLFIARLLFPTSTFDLLEDQYNIKKDITDELMVLHNTGKNKEARLAHAINSMIKTYALRPIDWLKEI